MKCLLKILCVFNVIAGVYGGEVLPVTERDPHFVVCVAEPPVIESGEVVVSSEKRFSWARYALSRAKNGLCSAARSRVVQTAAALAATAGVGYVGWYYYNKTYNPDPIPTPEIDKICLDYLKGFYTGSNCWRGIYINDDRMPDYYACLNYPYDYDYIDAPSPPRIPGALCAQHIPQSDYYVPFSGNFTFLYSNIRWMCETLNENIFGCSG
jgi:hypothetical protein